MSEMKDITVLKRNLAGEVTWQYGGRVLNRKTNYVVLEAFFDRDDTPVADVIFKRGDRFVETFYTDRWYNVFQIFDRDDGKFKGWYCNVGYPTVLEKDTISYVDLALDLWVAPDGTQTVLDENEFLELPMDVMTRAQAVSALEELKRRCANEKPPV
jgi:predicted RNA-binding protein associated with RNAse of E/G family